MEALRLDRIIASTGFYSRKEVKLLLKQGRVLVDGRPAAKVEDKYDPAAVHIAVNGEELHYTANTYLMLNKPAGLLSATEDSRSATVLELLTPELRRRDLFPVGRLDKDSEGLLLLTDDGILAHQLLSPKKHVDKIYYVRVEGCLSQADSEAFATGLTLDDGLACMPAKLEILALGDQGFVTLREGKFHQVKRMLAFLGKPVMYLRRVQMGNLTLDSALAPGEYRFLTDKEVEMLKNN